MALILQLLLIIAGCALANVQGLYNSLTPQEIQETLAWAPPPQLRNLSYILSGYDDEGSPVYIIHYGQWLEVETLDQMREDILKYSQQKHLRMQLAGKEPPGLGVVVITDMDYDESLDAHPTVQKLFETGAQAADELQISNNLKRWFIINAEGGTKRKMLKLISTLGKLGRITSVHGSNPLDWMPKILEHISPKQLPPQYTGGNVFDPMESYP